MCGIAGFISHKPIVEAKQALQKMTDSIAHRGPDGQGHYFNDNLNIGLGHRRLSIIDLSHEADQPMHYLDKYVLVFNGEIYNYLELKEDLTKQGYTFKTQSDTEVLIALYDKHGIKCLDLLDGMFAFVLYNKQTQDVFCARDRFGEKPFYFSLHNQTFYFASEMKALWAAGIPKMVNESMLFNYISYGSLFDTSNLKNTFYKNIFSLQHSHYLLFNAQKIDAKQTSYYNLHQKGAQEISFDEAKLKFRALFLQSLKRRLRSDVPIGSSLSGGLDSSLIVCAIDNLNKEKTIKQNTFSAVFPGFEKDESVHIKKVINSTNATPHYTTPSDKSLVENINKLAYHQEEPFGSASIFAQFSVMQLVKENNVTVLLDGQGADEYLAGYHKFFPPYLNELKATNKPQFQTVLANYKSTYSRDPYNAKSQMLSFVKRNFSNQIDALRKYRERYLQSTEGQFSNDFFGEHISKPFSLKTEFATLNDALYHATFSGFGIQELLRYADRNSMAHSLEVRLPFLSHELVEFAINLPASYKINGVWTKYIMRETFKDLLPEEICWRKDKIGYEPPQANWMENNDVKSEISAARKNLVSHGILNKKILSKPVQAEAVSERSGNEWRHWMAGKMME
jgi:asparagine synthase (glutamine-hydrolysing)